MESKASQVGIWLNTVVQTYCNCSDEMFPTKLQNISPCPFKSKSKGRSEQVLHQPYIHFVRDAVYVFAHALHNLWRETCNTTLHLCPHFAERTVTGLKDFLHGVNFSDVDGFPFKFEEKENYECSLNSNKIA